MSRQIEREKEVALEREQKKQEAAAAGPTQPPPPPESHDSNPVNQSAREYESGSRGWRPSANSEGDGWSFVESFRDSLMMLVFSE